MRTSFSIIVSIVVLTAFASPANIHYIVHEKRDVETSDRVPTAIEVDQSTIIPLSIALTQRNLEKGQDFLMDVSDPFSPNYRKHWTAQKVISMICKVPLADCRRSLRLLPRRIRQSRR
jgi:tripeptidyl-peptidase-1